VEPSSVTAHVRKVLELAKDMCDVMTIKGHGGKICLQDFVDMAANMLGKE
jgi:hypothetical protein